MGFFASDIVDLTVSLTKDGSSAVGSNLALSPQWPGSDASASYGGSANLWGTTLTPAEVNAATFGLLLKATNNSGTAKVDYITLTVYYTLPTAQDNPAFLSVVKVNADRATMQPLIYSLPRAGFTVAQDPNLARARSDAVFRMSRIIRPGRADVKVYERLEGWVEMSPASNIPGVQFWASIDEATAIQLRDQDGAAVTVKANRVPFRVYFPRDTTAEGHYVQLRPTVPALAGGEQNVAIKLRDMALYGSYSPREARTFTAVILLGERVQEFADTTIMRRTVKGQKEALEATIGRRVTYKSPHGEAGYVQVESVTVREIQNLKVQKWQMQATVTMREVNYA